MISRPELVLAISALLVPAFAAAADASKGTRSYRWVDEHGVTLPRRGGLIQAGDILESEG